MSSPTTEDTERPSWHGRRELLRASLRALVLAALALVFLKPRILATCAWAVFPVSYFEFWAVSRGRSSIRLGVASFLFATVVLAAAYFQAIYAGGVLKAHSLDGGILAIRADVSELLGPRRGFPGAVFFVYALECQALGCALATLVRVSGDSWDSTILSWILVFLLAPVADWVIFAILTQSPRTKQWDVTEAVVALAMVSTVSAALLAVGSLLCAGGLLTLYTAVDKVLERRPPSGSPKMRPE